MAVIFWVGLTDSDWFRRLSSEQPVEVNFWQPSGRVAFRALAPGGLFLFKLHHPTNFVVGGGWFVCYSALPASVAWKAFEERNGVASLPALISRVRKYLKSGVAPDPVIGCSILERPFFWAREQWIDLQGRWSPNIVRGRTFDTTESEGASLWAEVLDRLRNQSKDSEYLPGVADLDLEAPRWTREFLTRSRLGQGAFRILVTEAYERRCAVTGEKTLPVLEAAHIRPFTEEGPHKLSNGLLLRSDLHTLFDLGYLTVTTDLRIKVSSRIRAEYENGRDYYALHGETLKYLPTRVEERPGDEYLTWHNKTCFRE